MLLKPLQAYYWLPKMHCMLRKKRHLDHRMYCVICIRNWWLFDWNPNRAVAFLESCYRFQGSQGLFVFFRFLVSFLLLKMLIVGSVWGYLKVRDYFVEIWLFKVFNVPPSPWIRELILAYRALLCKIFNPFKLLVLGYELCTFPFFILKSILIQMMEFS